VFGMSNPKRAWFRVDSESAVACGVLPSAAVLLLSLASDAAAAAALLPQASVLLAADAAAEADESRALNGDMWKQRFWRVASGFLPELASSSCTHTLSKDCCCVLSGLGFYCVASGKWVGVAVKSLLFFACAFWCGPHADWLGIRLGFCSSHEIRAIAQRCRWTLDRMEQQNSLTTDRFFSTSISNLSSLGSLCFVEFLFLAFC
jgi:hypothetical protein